MKKIISALIITLALGPLAFAVGSGVGSEVVGGAVLEDAVNDGETTKGATQNAIFDAIAAGGGGSGDVVGPASSVDNTVTRFDGVTGKLLQGSNVTVSDAGVLASTVTGAAIDIGSADYAAKISNPTVDQLYNQAFLFIQNSHEDNAVVVIKGKDAQNNDLLQFQDDAGDLLGSFFGNGQGYSTTQSSFGIFGWNNTTTGNGGHVQLVAGNSVDANAGDVILIPGFSDTNGMGNIVLLNKDTDALVGLWGADGIYLEGEQAFSLGDGTFTLSLRAPSPLTENVQLFFPSVMGADGDVLTLGTGGQLEFTTPAAGGGSFTTFTVTSTLDNASFTHTGKYKDNGDGTIDIWYTNTVTGGAGSGTNFRYTLPPGFTFTSADMTSTNTHMPMCEGAHYNGASVYNIKGFYFDTDEVAIKYQDGSGLFVNGADNSPSSAAAGQYWNVHCVGVPAND